ncbi:MAG: FHA domain-containing protein [Bdellovibrio sp.]|nr:MAG: FHA domain-containing protein [Bdellovibrio sp.]
MKRVELHITHLYQNKYMGFHRLKEKSTLLVGSSREVDLHLLGEGVSGIHALFEFHDGRWTVSDLGSDRGTWIQKKPIVSFDIHTETKIRIGGHELKVVPKVVEGDLFTSQGSPEDLSKGELYHQVVVRKSGFVTRTELLKKDQDFIFYMGNKEYCFSPPSEISKWKITPLEDVEIQQRLVYASELKETFWDKIKTFKDPNLKTSFLSAVMLSAIVFGLIWLAPRKPKDEMLKLNFPKNKFTRMIYDAKVVRKKRQRAASLRKKIHASTSASNTPVAQKSSSKVSKGKQAFKVISKIKASGLTRLLGKISKRASKKALFIAGQGKNPDMKGLGRSLAAVGSIKGLAGKKFGSLKGKTFKVSGIGTLGSGNGNAIKGLGKLDGRGVGGASVGILEEETEIQGGLDKEVIARVIQSNLGQIRYCYERQLSARPDLYGKVLVKFTIGPSGSVVLQKVTLSTLNSSMVEGCILRRIAGWRFPPPKGGTSVLVTYPFLFKSTN